MTQVFSYIFSALVGFFLWWISAMLLSGPAIFRAANSIEKIVFFAPIIGIIIPVFTKLAANNKGAIGAWLLALSPILGAINSIFAVIIYKAMGEAPGTEMRAQIFVCIIWLVPFFIYGKQIVAIQNKQH